MKVRQDGWADRREPTATPRAWQMPDCRGRQQACQLPRRQLAAPTTEPHTKESGHVRSRGLGQLPSCGVGPDSVLVCQFIPPSLFNSVSLCRWTRAKAGRRRGPRLRQYHRLRTPLLGGRRVGLGFHTLAAQLVRPLPSPPPAIDLACFRLGGRDVWRTPFSVVTTARIAGAIPMTAR